MSASDVRASARLAVLTVLATCASTCGGVAEELTEPPDVSLLLTAYADPGGTLDPSRPATWLQVAQAQLEVLGGGTADMVIGEMVARSMDRIDRAVASLPAREGGLVPAHVDGVVTLNVSCGAGSKETADVAVAIVDGAVSPLLWGTAYGCPLWKRGGVRAVYEGRFTMYRYPDGDLLVGLDGNITGARTPVRSDFRIVGGRLEKRVTTPTGDVIAARDGVDVLARAANGTFRCDASRRTCR